MTQHPSPEGAQDEALRLADALEGGKLIDDSTEWADTLHAAADELRRLHARVQEQQAQLTVQARLLGISAEREMALRARVQELERELAVPQWVSVAERLPEFLDSCDWLHRNEIKQECWVLCGESMATASVPGRSTHWRPAQPIPTRARGAQGESNG